MKPPPLQHSHCGCQCLQACRIFQAMAPTSFTTKDADRSGHILTSLKMFQIEAFHAGCARIRTWNHRGPAASTVYNEFGTVTFTYWNIEYKFLPQDGSSRGSPALYRLWKHAQPRWLMRLQPWPCCFIKPHVKHEQCYATELGVGFGV